MFLSKVSEFGTLDIFEGVVGRREGGMGLCQCMSDCKHLAGIEETFSSGCISFQLVLRMLGMC